MGLYNIFTQESTKFADVKNRKKPNFIPVAERISQTVNDGVNSECYYVMNSRLEEISQRGEDEDVYVFEHPSIISRYYAITILIVISLVFAVYLFIGACTTKFSTELNVVGLFFVGASSAILTVNIALIMKLISVIRFKKRFDVYEELLGYKSMEFIEDIASCTKQKELRVIKDLKKAIKMKLIPQGHFCRQKNVLMVSDVVYERYMEKPDVYDYYFRKMMEERHRVKSRTKKIAQIMEMGEQYVGKLQGYSSMVGKKSVVQNIITMKNIVSMIFYEIDANPSQASELSVFLNYYLPTTEKLLDTYITMEEKKVSSKQEKQAKEQIEKSISLIIGAYGRILEKLYEEREIAITSEISAMELVMKQEGLPN